MSRDRLKRRSKSSFDEDMPASLSWVSQVYAFLTACDTIRWRIIMASARKSRKRVLVVDDDRALNHVLTEMLSAAGYEAKSAGDGIAAIQRLERDQYDLVLLDINLPKLSGLDVLKQ